MLRRDSSIDNRQSPLPWPLPYPEVAQCLLMYPGVHRDSHWETGVGTALLCHPSRRRLGFGSVCLYVLRLFQALRDGSERADAPDEAFERDRFVQVNWQKHAVVVVGREDEHPVVDHLITRFLWLMPAHEEVHVKQLA